MEHQLGELQLVKCSLLPGELFDFVEHCTVWEDYLDSFTSTASTDAVEVDFSAIPPCRFTISLSDYSQVHFEIELPRSYPEKYKPIILVKGEDITRAEQELWMRIVQERLDEVLTGGMEYPVYQLLSTYLIPLLHEAATQVQKAEAAAQDAPSETSSSAGHYHALLTSHHLVSPTKRRNLQLWSSQLSLSGFSKVGYPGVIYAEGAKENVEDFVGRIKAMNWLALRVRFVENLVLGETQERQGVKWKEFEKVGEVVEEMRNIGRDKWVVEMGIGSSHSGKADW
ncbi:hypothetical protein VNI00_004469 [Paramarasmius palmivorus]|uniref:Small nuclear ribonucleoprotein Prp3 C-terminal domain-containing protein n=1 Tax=Paramarasmius palmivorus TaxID=297713 RepID=A0AAW0DJC3_9AGAR